MSSSDPSAERLVLSGQLDSEIIVAIGSFLLLRQRDSAGLWGQVSYREVRHQTQEQWAKQWTKQECEAHNEF